MRLGLLDGELGFFGVFGCEQQIGSGPKGNGGENEPKRDPRRDEASHDGDAEERPLLPVQHTVAQLVPLSTHVRHPFHDTCLLTYSA